MSGPCALRVACRAPADCTRRQPFLHDSDRRPQRADESGPRCLAHGESCVPGIIAHDALSCSVPECRRLARDCFMADIVKR
jgi:hypothetical protein